ncbi:insulinase like peptidase [Cryptosporidium canis]|nr:insulinase like peptidase [Cryptosporidium canis]
MPADKGQMPHVKRYTLANRLEVLLVSGSDRLTSSVSFGLNLGSFFDPREYLGFSRVLSCLFQYIPGKENEFMKLVDSIHKKGQTCITYYWIPQSSETTAEFSGIFSSECLDEYLGRIRSSLDVLEYPVEIVSRCMEMQRKEYESEAFSGAVYRRAIIRSIFDSGLQGSLVVDQEYDIQGLALEIKRFKRKYYSSRAMKLIIESSFNFEYLIKLVNKHFSTIPNFEIDVKGLRSSLGISSLRPERLFGSLVDYKGPENKISLIFVLDSEKGASLASRRMPLFEYFVKHYFCGEFSGSLRNAISPLVLTCSVDYFVDRLAFVWLEVESEGENIAMEETLELVYSSVVLLRKTGIEQDYLDFLRNNCIANYMNYDLMDYKISIQDRVDSLINYNIWHKLDRFCSDSGPGVALEEFNRLLAFLDVENLLILVNSYQVNYLMNTHNYGYDCEDRLTYNEEYTENCPDYTENETASSSTFLSSSGTDDGISRVSRNRTLDQEEDHQYSYLEPFLKIKYNVGRIPARLRERLERTKESLGLINGISRPFINPYTPKHFKLVNFIWAPLSKASIAANCLDNRPDQEQDEEASNQTYLPSNLLLGMGSVFSSKSAAGSDPKMLKYSDTQISLVKNINIWYKARNDQRFPYFRGALRLSSPLGPFTIINFILSFVLAISLRSIINFPLIQDAKLSLSLNSGPDHSSLHPSIDFQIAGYSSSLYPLLETISTTLNSDELLSDAYFSESVQTYKAQLVARKHSMTSVLKARELSWRLTTPNYPSLGRQLLGLSQVTQQRLVNAFRQFKENLCIDGLFVGNLDRMELEDLLKGFSSNFGSGATSQQCLKGLNRRSFAIKDVRGTAYRRMVYHYIRPAPLSSPSGYNCSSLEHKASPRASSKSSMESFFKHLGEEFGEIHSTNGTIQSGYLDCISSSNDFGPNIALLDIIVYTDSVELKSDDMATGILYLNDAYYNIMWFKESLKITKASLSLKTSVERFDGYFKWSIQLESCKYSANDLGLYISHLTSLYQSSLQSGSGEDFDLIKKLTVSKLRSRLTKTGIDEEFSSHRFNIGYLEYMIEDLGRLEYSQFVSRMSQVLRDNALFLLVQVQSTALNELSLTPSSRSARLKARDHAQARPRLGTTISIPAGFKHIKHIDELVQDDRIPIHPPDFD